MDAREIRIALREAQLRIEDQIIERFHSPSPECTDGRVTDICVTFNRITDSVSDIQAVFSVLFSSVRALGLLGLALSRSAKEMIRNVTGVTRRHQEEQAERVLAEADRRPISEQVLEDSRQDALDLIDDAGYCDDTSKKELYRQIR